MDRSLRFLEGDGGNAARMRAIDWSATPLGPPAAWPRALRTVLSLMLASKFPMFVAWGPDLTFLYNDAYTDILGQKHPAALGRPFEAVWAEIWPDLRPLVDRALAGEAVYQEDLPLTMRRKGYEEATWFTFSYSPVYDDDGHVAGMYCACTETTEAVVARRRHERELERLRTLFQQAPGIIAVLRGPDHVFELANDAYQQLVGARDLIGRPVTEALPEVAGQGFMELLDRVYASGDPFVGRGVPVQLRRQPGAGPQLEERFVDFIYQPIRDEAGHVAGIFVEGSDVTEAVQAMAAVREREQRLLQFANTIHHLAWIANADGTPEWFNDRWYAYTGTTPAQMREQGWRELVHPDDRADAAARWTVSMRTGQPYEAEMRLLGADGRYRIFHGTAAPVRDAAGQIVQWFGTNTDITDARAAQEVRPLLAARGHALETRVPTPAPTVVADRTRLTQVVSNLLHNAAKYTPPGGAIALTVGVGDGQLRLAVEDNGIGIQADLLPEVFNLFTQAARTPDRAQGGLGIGLALVRGLVELHGGTVEAHSDGPGRGARFVVTLPLAEPTLALAPQAAPTQPAAEVARRVMVVDDNLDGANALAELLAEHGHAVRVHDTPAAALAAADAERHDALVLDIGMPGMDGYELARRIRAGGGASADALLIALTGYGQRQDRAATEAAGFDAHLVKPADLARLLGLLARGRDARAPREALS